MWKAHSLTGKMHRQTYQYNNLTLTFDIFHVNRNTIPEFSQNLYHQFSTFHSTLVVNYASQASFEPNWVLLTAFLFLRAYWIVSAGPSGHLKQSIERTVFEQRTTSTRLRPQNERSCSATVPTRLWLAICYLDRFCFSRDALTLINIGKHIEKPLSMKQLWTTLADRRRAGPPAFRRKYRPIPKATLSFSLGGRLFLGNFGLFRSGEGPAPSPLPGLDTSCPKSKIWSSSRKWAIRFFSNFLRGNIFGND